MRLYALLLLTLSLSFVSCNKNNDCPSEVDVVVDEDQLELDKATIAEYLSENEIDAELDPSGISYIIKREGDGDRPGLCNAVAVTYELYSISDDSKLIERSPDIVTFNLQRLIPGWQIGIPLIKEGGRIRLFIPSVYAYGARGGRIDPDTGEQDIPPNESLIFEITLVGTY